MIISPALAHGTSTGGTAAGGFVPLILIAVIVVFFLARLSLKKWRRCKLERNVSGAVEERNSLDLTDGSSSI